MTQAFWTQEIRTLAVPVALLLFGLGVAGCSTASCCPPPGPNGLDRPIDLDRGDWVTSERTQVWKIIEEQRGAIGVHRGYLVAREYRQMRGGPSYTLYTVTGLNRRDRLGHIDQMGRAFRYAPNFNAGFDEVDVGTSTLPNSVGAILQTQRPITLEPTNERRLAFESLDKDRSGVLEVAEIEGKGDRIRGADTNADGVIDFQEFDALDVL